MILLIAAHTCFGSQVGLARFAEGVGIDPIAWSAYWITEGCLAAAAYLTAMKGQLWEVL